MALKLHPFQALQVDYTFPPNAIVGNPDKRITVQQILRHPWYQQVWLFACKGSHGYTRPRGSGGQPTISLYVGAFRPDCALCYHLRGCRQGWWR
jgi:hypothetical protein